MKYLTVLLAQLLLVALPAICHAGAQNLLLTSVESNSICEKKATALRLQEGGLATANNLKRNLISTAQDYAFLGIYSEGISQEKARALGFDNPYGNYVTRVIEDTPAERAGLQPFDYIYGIDEYRTGRDQNLIQILRKYEAGEKASLHLIRKGRRKTLGVTFGRRGEGNSRERDKCEEPFFGISAKSMDKGLGKGIPVNIVDNSTAESMGLEDGDHIITINGYKMIDWKDISTAIDNMEVGNEINVEYLRGGEMEKKSAPIKSYCETKTKESLNIKVAPNPGEWFGRYFQNEKDKDREVRGYTTIIQDVDKEAAPRIEKEYGVKVSTDNRLEVQDMSIRPGPEAGRYELQFVLPSKGETTVNIYNLSGRRIYQYGLGSFSGSFSDQVNLSQNGSGKYLLEVRQGEKARIRELTVISD